MPQVSYSSGSLTKRYSCVEVNLSAPIVGNFLPLGPSSIQGTFTNAIGQTFVLTVSVGVGGNIAAAGTGFNLGGPTPSFPVTFTFDRKYAGNFGLSVVDFDNSGVSSDKICNATIGNPDILHSQLELIGNCVQMIAGNNPLTPRSFAWSEVDNLTSFTFTYSRTNMASITNFTPTLFEKSIQQWEFRDLAPIGSFVDPLTNTVYTTLPAGVKIATCEEDQRYLSYSKELCYEISSPIAFALCASPGEAWAPYQYQRPRTDGVASLNFIITGSQPYEFSLDGTILYSINAGLLYRGFYSKDLTYLGNQNIPLSFTANPAVGFYTPVGLAIHPESELIYALYRDAGTTKLYLCTIINGNVELVGDCQFLSNAVPILHRDDIVFSKSGQLIYGHGENLFLVNHETGVINPTPIAIPKIASNAFGVGNLSRFENGDIYISGQANVLGPIAYIIDGESYTVKQDWSSNNSSTPPNCPFSVAYPKSPISKFQRLFFKNIESNTVTYDDRDLLTGAPVTIPQNASLNECGEVVSKKISWTEDLCYVLDKLPTSQGIIQLVGGQMSSDPACNPIGGFVSPPVLTHTTFTHNTSGNLIYAINSVGPNLDAYTWNPVSTPTFFSTVLITGIVGTIKSIRTRWTDGTTWLMTEEAPGAFRIFRFYIINTTTGACTLQGSANYPAGLYNNGSFAWGIDDNLYFSYNIGAGNYRVSKLSKVSYNIANTIADVNYVIDNISADLPNQRLMLMRVGTGGIDFLSYNGQIVGNCTGVSYGDAMYAMLGEIRVGDQITKVKRVFIKDEITGDVSSFYHDYLTGEDIVLPNNARLVDCDTSIKVVTPSIPRVQLVTGINSWSKLLNAPNAKSITFTRLANIVTINDGFSIATINAAFSTTWAADQLGGNLIFSGTAAGSSFVVTWI